MSSPNSPYEKPLPTNPFREAIAEENSCSTGSMDSKSLPPQPENELFSAPPSYVGEGHIVPAIDVKANASSPSSSYPSPSYSSPEQQYQRPGPQLVFPTTEAYGSSSSPYYAPIPAGYDVGLLPNPDPKAIPPCFSRPPPDVLSYPSFKAVFLVANQKSLEKGFPLACPPSNDRPHPFVSHDINEADWLGFLHAIQSAASLTEKDLRRSHLPIISIVPFINDLSAYGVQQYMKTRKIDVVVRTIDKWNHHFFEQRKTRIVLMKGQAKLTGLTERPVADLHTPVPTNSATISERIAVDAESSKSKGKSPEKSEDVYRLFLVPHDV